jgi:hypothetical protein
MNSEQPTRKSPWQLSLRELLLLIAVFALAAAYAIAAGRNYRNQNELVRLRREVGYLAPSDSDQVAAVRLTSDQPLTYRLRVRVPDSPRYRVAYSSLWPKATSAPDWYAAAPLPAGESVVTVRILKDTRDDRWKITTLVQSDAGTKRIATVLPGEQSDVFRQSHDVVSAGVGRQTVALDKSKRLRLLDDKWLVGEGGLMLYGNKPPQRDQIGVYAELQPDIGTL